ncbi:MAG: hypothetical protein WCY58_13540 [Mariniphaga sp.]
MELIIPFKKIDYDSNGTHLKSGKIIYELQKEREESYHIKFNPLYANVIEGHPLAMQRLTQYHNIDEAKNYDFGMELIEGEIDIDTNLEIEEYSDSDTVYAIGSQLLFDEDGDGEPILLVKNEKLKDDILVLKYDSDDDEEDIVVDGPVNEKINAS